MRNIANAQVHEIAAAELAVDREVEHRQGSKLMGVVKPNSDRRDVLRLERRIRPDHLAFVPGFPSVSAFHFRLRRN